jgi:hypothetical protein
MAHLILIYVIGRMEMLTAHSPTKKVSRIQDYHVHVLMPAGFGLL